MIVIQKENDDVTIKVEKGTKRVEMIMGCVFLVEALKKEIDTDTDTILADIKKLIEQDEVEMEKIGGEE